MNTSRTMRALANSSRREFLKSSAAGSAGLLLAFHWPTFARATTADNDTAGEPNAFITIDPNGQIRLVITRSEMGQGVRTSLAMILAEELDADWSRVEVGQGDCDPQYGDMTTGGSMSIRSTWGPLRKAGASARDMLLTAAAQTWNVPKGECSTTGNNMVVHKKTGQESTYGALAAKAAVLPVPKDVALKDSKDYRIVGTKRARVDGQHIVIGEAHYGIDTKVPGMLCAVVARPTVFGGKVKKFDATKALAVPGVKKVFEVPAVELPPLFGEERKPDSGHQHYLWGGVAVVADSTWQAIAGRRALTIEWDSGPGADESTEKQRAKLAELLKTSGKELKKIGDPQAAIGSAAKTVEAEYETPFLAHMTMEPVNCTASVRDGQCEVWAPTQNPNALATALASVLSFPQSALTIHITLIGGGFGRRLCIDYGVEAALISRAAGAPVKVIWTRDDDIRHDYYRPISRHQLRAGIDAQNNVTAWSHHIAAPSTDSTFLGGELPDTGGTEIAGPGLPGGTVPNYLLQQSFLHTAVPRGYWRAVDMNWNHFAVQCFMDEIAAATKKDPLALRRQLIASRQKPSGEADNEGDAPVNVERLLAVLDLAAEKSGWGKPLPQGRGRGIAGLYGFGSYVAHVAEVTVAKDGTLHVDRVVVAVDCGQVINPDMVAAQVEGGVVFGLTSALYDEITIENGQVQQANFDTYPMLRIADMPKIEVHLVPSHEAPGGIGEPGVPSTAPAVANAIFAATGKRLRRLPFQTQELAQS
ncbi:MAG TPA: xanthine dehydrogenase family protein molybdopterin-binding subunit [Candidatus Acidoferrales bacterium]|jgi:isoquinoline 1-oxidoreductase beta subunit|nr:xanthine dehydrogenase family protein molybdopterin-binding subunit [Candidatus Acidoferrales bacterium]